MDILSVLSFLGVAVLLTLMPGPDNLFVLAQSISFLYSRPLSCLV